MEIFSLVEEGYTYIWQSKRSEWSDIKSFSELSSKYRGLKDVYFGVAVHKTPGNSYSRGSRDTLLCVPALWADIDVATAYHKKPTLPPSHKAVYDEILGKFMLEPSLVINTGGGVHAYWQLSAPEFDLERAGLAVRTLQAALQHIAKEKGWAIDSTHDLMRVLRLPGTINSKAGTAVMIEQETGHLYSIEDILDATSILPINVQHSIYADKKATITLNPEGTPPIELWQQLIAADKTVLDTFEHQRSDLIDQSLSGYDLSLAVRAARAGWTDQQICDLLVAHRRRWKGDIKTAQYYERTIAKARENPSDPPPLQVSDKQSALDIVNAQLAALIPQRQFRIAKVVKFSTYGEPTYRLEIEHDGVTEAISQLKVSKLINEASFRDVIAASANILIPKIPKSRWQVLAQLLLDSCEALDVGEAGEEQIRELVSRYLRDNPVAEESEYQEALMNDAPFIKGGTVYIILRSLACYTTRALGETISVRQLAIMLRAAGAYAQTIYVAKTSKLAWAIPWEEVNNGI